MRRLSWIELLFNKSGSCEHAIKRRVRWLSLVLGLVLTGCGTLANPVMQAPTATQTAVMIEGEVQPTAQPTNPPTNTPIPPTETPIPEPTATSTPEATATTEPTATAVLSPVDRLVAVRNAENGKVLFELFQETAGSGYACVTCHSATSEEKLTGPGLLNIAELASTRVEGQSAAEYVYNSIVNPNDYLVEGFEAEVMPQNWADIYSNLEIFDIVAYVLTLPSEADGA